MNWSALHLRSTNTLLFRKCNYAMLTNTCLALSHLSVCGRRETRPAESRHLRIARWGPCPRRTTADTESAHVVVSGSTGRPSAGQTCEFSVSHASIPGVPQYAVRTQRPRLVRVPRTYSTWGLGKPPCASGTYPTREAGTRSLYVPNGGPGAYVSAQVAARLAPG